MLSLASPPVVALVAESPEMVSYKPCSRTPLVMHGFMMCFGLKTSMQSAAKCASHSLPLLSLHKAAAAAWHTVVNTHFHLMYPLCAGGIACCLLAFSCELPDASQCRGWQCSLSCVYRWVLCSKLDFEGAVAFWTMNRLH